VKNYLSIFFLFFSLATYSSGNNKQITFLSKDSIADYPHYLYEGWRFTKGDDSAMALPSYDDSKWKQTRSTLNLSDKSTPSFKGIGWFRFHFTSDSTITGRPLAMTMTHFGASQIYLDGKLIKSFGRIAGADSSVYEDPQERPFIFMIPDTGANLIAVRYANYNAEKNYSVYLRPMAGFKMMVGETDLQIRMKDVRSTVFSFILMLLSGIFFALCLIHLFMFLYYRNVLSNLYFSIFMFSLACCFVIAFICNASHTPSFILKSSYLLYPFIIVACICLSGFINELLHKKMVRFKIIVAMGIVTMLLGFFGITFSGNLISILIISVSFDTLFTVIFGIIRRVKGVRIIGTGLLFFTLFILTIFAIVMAKGGDVDLNDSTIGGQIFVVFLALAILSIPFSMSVYLAWNFNSINKDLALQLENINILSKKTLEQEQEKQRMLESRKEELEDEVMKRTSELRDEKKEVRRLVAEYSSGGSCRRTKNERQCRCKAV